MKVFLEVHIKDYENGESLEFLQKLRQYLDSQKIEYVIEATAGSLFHFNVSNIPKTSKGEKD